MKWLSYVIWLLPFSNIYAQTCEDGSAPVVQSAVIGGMKSWDSQGDSDNESTLLCGFPANGNIVGAEHSGIDISPQLNSYCNEARFRLNNAVTLTPAVGENNVGPCINNYSGGSISHLQDNGLIFQADGAGCVTIESFESFDDVSDFADADITAGVITLYACPAGLVLPIELRYFRGESENKTNKITWATSSELNTEWHIVERSNTGSGSWKKISRTAGAGTSNEDNIYEHIDQSPFPISYYRIKILDFDGSVQYSKTIVIEKENIGLNILSISPNPVVDLMEIKYFNDNEPILQINIFNVLGREIKSENIISDNGLNRHFINMGGLPTGSYYIVLNNGFQRRVECFEKL